MAQMQQITAGSIVIRHTFFDVYDEGADERRRGSRRSRSLGDAPRSPKQSTPAAKQLSFAEPPAQADICDEVLQTDIELVEGLAVQHLQQELGQQGNTDAVAEFLAMVSEELGDDVSSPSPEKLVSALHSVAKYCDGMEASQLGRVKGHPRFASLVAAGFEASDELAESKLLIRFLWSLAKLNLDERKVTSTIQVVAAKLTWTVDSASPQDISNSLWSLARLSGDGEGSSTASSTYRRLPEVHNLAHRLVQAGMAKLEQMVEQSLTNCLWALAKLDLRDVSSSWFATGCMQRLCGPCLQNLCPQGLANSAWAAARLRLDASSTQCFILALVSQALAQNGQLSNFQPQELSMMMWAVAKVMGRRSCRGVVAQFAEAVAAEGQKRLPELSDQSVSNIAWALGTLDLVRQPSGPSRSFMLAAAMHQAPNLCTCSPQAISNLLWALSRVTGAANTLRSFGSLAAAEAMSPVRQKGFSWQDRASIMTALMHCQAHQDPAVKAFAGGLIVKARSELRQISTQALLNIAMAAIRMDLDTVELHSFVEALELALQQRSLNDIDRRQLAQVRMGCLDHRMR